MWSLKQQPLQPKGGAVFLSEAASFMHVKILLHFEGWGKSPKIVKKKLLGSSSLPQLQARKKALAFAAFQISVFWSLHVCAGGGKDGLQKNTQRMMCLSL